MPTRFRTSLLFVAVASVVLLIGCGPQLPPTTFAAPVNYRPNTNPYAVVFADVTGDGVSDAILSRAHEIEVLPGGPPGTFGSGTIYPLGALGPPRSIATGDLDGDGIIDVVAGTGSNLYRWERSGTSLVAGPTIAIDANDVRIADVTGDGRDDLIVLGWSTNTLSVFAQSPSGVLSGRVDYSVNVGGYNDLAIGDVDGDGDRDVVAMSGQTYAKPNLTVLLQNTAHALVVRGSWSVAGTNIITRGVAIGNVDGDALPEVVVSNFYDSKPKVTVFEADASGGLTQSDTFDVVDGPTPVELADMNGDSYDDAVVGNSGWSSVSVLYGGPDGITVPPQVIHAGSGGVWFDGLAVADVTGDGRPDIGEASNIAGFTFLRNTG